MAYVALYRQWRPQFFADLVGQAHISRTLKNAVSGGRISHAYLFTGPRGTGKTSSAKIMAKAVNCLEPVAGEPCGKCASCLRVSQGGAMDIVEIDAASNRGIDEIRDLREKVKYAPVEGRYKVYIIDEVHMLTTEAFNALLKTLEEPPRHVIFILATTEPYKVPVTVLSRCQRFDFKRIAYREIIGRLTEISQASDFSVSREALEMIARKAEGSMRDALSLLDQCASFTSDQISEETVAEVLGTVGTDFMVAVAEAIAGRDLVTLLGQVDNLAREGKDMRQFLHDLLEFFRNFLLVKLSRHNDGAAGLSEYLFEQLQSRSAILSEEELFSILQALGEADAQLRYSAQPRIPLEISLIKAAGCLAPASPPPGLPRMDPLPAQRPGPEISNLQPDRGRVDQPRSVGDSPAPPEVGPAAAAAVGNGPGSPSVNLDLVRDHWKKFLETVRKQRPSTYAYLVEGEPVEVVGNKIILSFKPNFQLHMSSLEQPNNRTVVEKSLQAVFGLPLAVQGVIAGGGQKNPDLVEEAKALFGADVVEVQD